MTYRIESGKLVENEEPRSGAKIVVMRHAHGITINPVSETLLDEDGNDIVFDNEDTARKFLEDAGFDDESMEFLFFVELDNVPEEVNEDYKRAVVETDCWYRYTRYLIQWAEDHSDPCNAGCSPVGYNEWLDNEEAEEA